MNKLILVLTLILVSFSPLKAQTVFPTFADNPSWNVLECFYLTCSTQTYQFVYDTTFCNQTYSKIEFDNNIDGYFRSDSLQTKFRISTNCNDKEFMLYDYSLNPGDTTYVGYSLELYPNDTTPAVLMQIDTVNYFGVDRQRFKLKFDHCNMGFMMDDLYWIRGIGATLHPFYSIPCLCDFCEGYFTVLCYDSSATQLYQNPIYNTCDTTAIVFIGLDETLQDDNFTIFPNPFQTETQISLDDSKSVNIKIYNSTGQLLQFITGERKLFIGSELKPGIYFMEIRNEDVFTQHKLVKL